MGALFGKECRQAVFSIPFLIYIVVLCFFVFTQYTPGIKKVEMPQPGQAEYGTKLSGDPEVIMPAALKSLYGEFAANVYIAYPVAFYKEVRLNDGQQREMAGILSAMTGIPENELLASGETPGTGLSLSMDDLKEDSNGNYSVTLPEIQQSTGETLSMEAILAQSVDYASFCEWMEKADRLIGGGSKYGETYLARFSEVPMTYEEALVKYNQLVNEDRITGAYARLFCDYLGAVLALFPVFMAVSCSMKDRRAGMQELVYSRQFSSIKIVLVRTLVQICISFVPVLLMAAGASAQLGWIYVGFGMDHTAFLMYSFVWLLPTLLVSVSVGMFLTELTGTPVAVAVQGLWWFVELNTGIKHIDGGYGWDLALRHNEIGNLQVYLDNYQTLLVNRICYTAFAVLLIILTVVVYEYKRRGKWHANFGGKKSSAHSCSESAA